MAPKPENSGAEPLDPDASTPPVMVHVVAPATLPEGYTFEAQIGGNVERTFKVEVVRAHCSVETMHIFT
jgi:hypothetical protein